MVRVSASAAALRGSAGPADEVEDRRGVPLNVESLYPNPTDGTATLHNTAGIRSVRVADINGRVVFGQHFESVVTSCPLDLHALSPGMYLVTATLLNGYQQVYKLVRN